MEKIGFMDLFQYDQNLNVYFPLLLNYFFLTSGSKLVDVMKVFIYDKIV